MWIFTGREAHSFTLANGQLTLRLVCRVLNAGTCARDGMRALEGLVHRPGVVDVRAARASVVDTRGRCARDDRFVDDASRCDGDAGGY